MATICNSGNGRLVASVTNAPVAPLAISWNGQPGLPISFGVCVGLALNQSIAAQFQLAFNSSFFVTPFGDNIGDLQLSFLTNTKCSDNNVSNGVADFLNTYLTNRLLPNSTASANPIAIAIGSIPFKGYIVGSQLQGRVDNAAIVTGTLAIKVWR